MKILDTLTGCLPWRKRQQPTEQQLLDLYTATMNALDRINACITKLSNTIDQILPIVHQPDPTEAQLNAAADALDVQDARLRAAFSLDAPAPVVVPMPAPAQPAAQ